MYFYKEVRYGRRLMRTKTKRMPPAATAYTCVIFIETKRYTRRGIEKRVSKVNSKFS